MALFYPSLLPSLSLSPCTAPEQTYCTTQTVIYFDSLQIFLFGQRGPNRREPPPEIHAVLSPIGSVVPDPATGVHRVQLRLDDICQEVECIYRMLPCSVTDHISDKTVYSI